MKNAAIYYAIIAVGVIALAAGAFFVVSHHPARGYAGLGVGVLLVIAGIVAMVMARPKAIAK